MADYHLKPTCDGRGSITVAVLFGKSRTFGHRPRELSYVPCDFNEKPQRGIIRPVRIPSLSPVLRTRVPTECEIFAFSPQTWWLLNLFLVSFDKPSCSQRDIPLTQPLVTVYTGSHQSRRTLSGFDSNIHFASEVQYRKWLDHLSLSLQLLPPSSPTVFPLTLT